MDPAGSEKPNMSTQPLEDLHLRAIEQRKELHQTTAELKAKINATRQQFDVPRQLRQHFAPVALALAAIGLLSGFRVGGMLTRRY
jgi:hypothetical protein